MNHENWTILCVDDEPVNLKLLQYMLAPRGFTIVTADNGETALEKIEREKIDLVLLDIMMPGMDGFEVCRKIKMDSRCNNIPIIMITALSAKSDRIKGIEAGAEEFLSKPFDQMEVLARIKMLLKVKELSDELNHAYENISSLVRFGEDMIDALIPMEFDYDFRRDIVVNQLMRRINDVREKPATILMGVSDTEGSSTWYWYEGNSGTFGKSATTVSLMPPSVRGREAEVIFANGSETEKIDLQPILRELKMQPLRIKNIVCYLNDRMSIFALNYDRDVSSCDAMVLNSIVMHTLFLRSLLQVKETEDALEYLVHSLARMSEIHDDNPEGHIVRLGLYCELLAKRLNLSANFARAIRVQVSLHDVGKIYLPASMLKKTKKLTAEDWTVLKKHPLRGAEIIGDHPRFKLAQSIALTHHERWDGSGYPQGLRGKDIPIEARIASIADQYDALRNKSNYKPAYDHKTACKILTEGDGRTLPQHFDPQVLKAFKALSSEFEGIYTRVTQDGTK